MDAEPKPFQWPQAGDERGPGVRYVPAGFIDDWCAELARAYHTTEPRNDDA